MGRCVVHLIFGNVEEVALHAILYTARSFFSSIDTSFKDSIVILYSFPKNVSRTFLLSIAKMFAF